MSKAKDKLLDKLVSPFQDKVNLDFNTFVRSFTAGITRMAMYNYAYVDDDFTQQSLDFYKDALIGNPEYLINLDHLPKTYKYLSMDTPQYGEKTMRAFSNTEHKQDPQSVRIRDRQIKKYTNVGLPVDEWWEKYDPNGEIEYQMNSIGLRTKYEVEDLTPNEFIPIFGCSHTQGLGTAEKDIWYNHLGENLPLFNCAIASAGPMEAFLFMRQLYKEKPFKKAYVCIPHAERVVHASNRRIIEGGVHYQQAFLKEFELINQAMNSETRDIYANITISAIENFCIANDIELKMYAKTSISAMRDFIRWDIIAPAIVDFYRVILKDLKVVDPKIHDFDTIVDSTARDMIHYGKNWQRCITKYMLTQA